MLWGINFSDLGLGFGDFLVNLKLGDGDSVGNMGFVVLKGMHGFGGIVILAWDFVISEWI